MPLIILVIIIVLVFATAKSTYATNTNKDIRLSANLLKTNALLEQRIMDECAKQGMTVDEAYEYTVKKVIDMGFSPCVQKRIYEKYSAWFSTRMGYEYWILYDSPVVKNRREIFKALDIVPTDDELYKNFPTTEMEYKNEMNMGGTLAHLQKKGTHVTYGGYGLCKIVGYSIGTPETSYYVVQPIGSDQFVYIQIGDHNMRVAK